MPAAHADVVVRLLYNPSPSAEKAGPCSRVFLCHLNVQIPIFFACIMMDYNPFSFEEAEEICEDFEDLIDTEFTLPSADKSAVFLIDAVVVCPFGEQDKLKFIEYYHRVKDAAASLGDYNGDEYDVILLFSSAAGEANNSYLGIRKFAVEQGIKYNFPSS